MPASDKWRFPDLSGAAAALGWETAHPVAGQPPAGLDCARIWQAADKIVYSTTLQTPDTARTRIEQDFDPV